MNVKVVDCITGSGKTSAAINFMLENEGNYLFLTPFLSEIERIKKACQEKHFYSPINIGKGKLDNLHTLLEKKSNICSTHALFYKYNSETIDLIKKGNYILVLDESVNPLEIVDITQKDIQILINSQTIKILSDGKVQWLNLEYEGRFYHIMQMALTGNLYCQNETFMLWAFPIDIFLSFSNVIVLTYMFKAQIQRYYFDWHNIKYKFIGTYYNGKSYIFSDNISSNSKTENLSQLIQIYEDKRISKITNSDFDLSASWYTREIQKENSNNLKLIKNSIYNFAKNICKAAADDIIWTCFIDSKNELKGNGYTKSWLPFNIRATNDYQNCGVVIYTVNVFLNPYIKIFFETRGIKVNDDLYALSEMWQFIFRSRIRQGKPIKVLILSKRMRKLLKKELDALSNIDTQNNAL